jgi:hypothetical protein
VKRLLAVVLLALGGSGCASEAPVTPPPTYAAMSDGEALALIAERQAKITTVSEECDLELTDEKGQSVSLDGVLVASPAPPGKLRMQAVKFGQKVFDLTIVDGKGWVVLPESGPAAGKFDPAKMPARRVSDAFDLLGASFFRSATPIGGDSTKLIARGTALGRDDVVCEIDRATLTARRFVVNGREGEPASELELDRYTLTENGLVWPLRIRLKSPTGEVVLRVRSVELNGELAPGAFVPPKRAVALP